VGKKSKKVKHRPQFLSVPVSPELTQKLPEIFGLMEQLTDKSKATEKKGDRLENCQLTINNYQLSIE